MKLNIGLAHFLITVSIYLRICITSATFTVCTYIRTPRLPLSFFRLVRDKINRIFLHRESFPSAKIKRELFMNTNETSLWNDERLSEFSIFFCFLNFRTQVVTIYPANCTLCDSYQFMLAFLKRFLSSRFESVHSGFHELYIAIRLWNSRFITS